MLYGQTHEKKFTCLLGDQNGGKKLPMCTVSTCRDNGPKLPTHGVRCWCIPPGVMKAPCFFFRRRLAPDRHVREVKKTSLDVYLAVQTEYIPSTLRERRGELYSRHCTRRRQRGFSRGRISTFTFFGMQSAATAQRPSFIKFGTDQTTDVPLLFQETAPAHG